MKLSEFRKLIREEVRKVINEVEDNQIAVVQLSFAAPIVAKDKKSNKTFASPYKYKSSNPKAKIYSQQEWSANEIAPYMGVLTMFRTQIIGQGMDKFVLTLAVPYTGDNDQLVKDLTNLINKTFATKPVTVQGLEDSFGATFNDPDQLKNLLLSAIKTVQAK
jgi:hypothetical protein